MSTPGLHNETGKVQAGAAREPIRLPKILKTCVVGY